MYKFVTRDYSEVPEKYQIYTEQSDLVLESGFHLAIESEVLAALEGNYLMTREKVATQTYFCGGFRKRGIMTTNYDFLSSPFKIIKNGYNPSRNFLVDQLKSFVNKSPSVVVLIFIRPSKKPPNLLRLEQNQVLSQKIYSKEEEDDFIN